MRRSDIQGEAVFDVLADILEPLTTILTDEEVKQALQSKGPLLKAATLIMRKHKAEITRILATLKRQSREEYVRQVNIISLVKDILDLLNDPELQKLFQSA